MTTTSLVTLRCPRRRGARTALPTGGQVSVLRLESMCVGGGQGIAMALERLS